jgi:hypothetical protein
VLSIPPRDSIEGFIASRFLRRLEPHIQHQVARFLASDEGRDLVAELFTDLVTDLVTPSGVDDLDLLEILVLKLTERLADARPRFRQRLVAQMSRPSLPD